MSKLQGMLVEIGGWGVSIDGHCGVEGARVDSFVMRVVRLLVVVACWVATSLRSIEVVACWMELASRKILADVRSALVCVRRVFTLSATAAARWKEMLSEMFSSMRNATVWIAVIASLGTFGRRAAVRSTLVSLVQSYGSPARIHPLESSHLQASLTLVTSPWLLDSRSVRVGSFSKVTGVLVTGDASLEQGGSWPLVILDEQGASKS